MKMGIKKILKKILFQSLVIQQKTIFLLIGISFKVAKEKNKVDTDLEEDEDENREMANFKKKEEK